MAEVTVHLRYVRVAPRKARAVIDVIRGKKATLAQAQLNLLSKRAAQPAAKLLKAGLAAAKDKKLTTDSLFIKEAIVQEGPRLKRFRPHFRGIARPIDRQMSHITLVLSDERAESSEPRTAKKQRAGAK